MSPRCLRVLVKVDLAHVQPIDHHMYGPEDHLSVWLLSALSLLPADLRYTEVPR